MPIIIEIDKEQKYLTASYIGSVSDDELFDSWKDVYEGDEWLPGMPELIDLSALDDSKVTLDGFRKVSDYRSKVFRREGLSTVVVSVYAPKQFQRNIMEAYKKLNKNSPANINLFDSYEDAKAFIEGFSHSGAHHGIQNMRFFFDAMADGVCMINESHEIQYANKAMVKDFGSYLNKKCYEYFLDAKSVCAWCKNPIVFSGKPVRREWYSQKTQKTYDLIDTSFYNPDGSLAVLEIFRDISEFKKTEASLKKSEERYRLLFENSIDPIFIAQDSVIKMANQSTVDMIGYSEQELSEIPFIDLIHPEDRELVMNMHNRRLSGEDDYSDYSNRAINKAGHTIWLDIHGVRINWEGRPASIIFARDVTERKLIEFENAKHLQELKKALDEIKTLKGVIPICSFCKSIRNDEGAWDKLEKYINEHSDAEFTHSICPNCAKKHYPDFYSSTK